MNPHLHTPTRYVSRYVANPLDGYSTFAWTVEVWTAADNGQRLRLEAKVEINKLEPEENTIMRERDLAEVLAANPPPDLSLNEQLATGRRLLALSWLLWDRGMTDSPQPKPAQ